MELVLRKRTFQCFFPRKTEGPKAHRRGTRIDLKGADSKCDRRPYVVYRRPTKWNDLPLSR
jgi:hypothetical protein